MMTLNLELQPYLEDRVTYLLSKQTNVEYFFRDMLQYKISELEKAIFNIEKDVRIYERKYNLSSKDFYTKFETGELGDEDDYMIWSGLVELLRKNKSELKRIQW